MLSLTMWETIGFKKEELCYLLLPKGEWPEHLILRCNDHWIVPRVTGERRSTKIVQVKDFRTNEMVVARRYLFELLVRPIPLDRGMKCQCGLRECINPFHYSLGGMLSPRASKRVRAHGVQVDEDTMDLAKYILDDVWPKTSIKTYRQLASTATMMSGVPTTPEEIENVIKKIMPSLLPQIIEEEE